MTQKQANLQTFLAGALNKLRAGAGAAGSAISGGAKAVGQGARTAGTYAKEMAIGAGTQAAELGGKALGVNPGKSWTQLVMPKYRTMQRVGVNPSLLKDLARNNPRMMGQVALEGGAAATPLALLAQALTDKNAAFLEGFQRKCAELGIDPMPMVKAAQMGTYAPALSGFLKQHLPGMSEYAKVRDGAGGIRTEQSGAGQIMDQGRMYMRSLLNRPGFFSGKEDQDAVIANEKARRDSDVENSKARIAAQGNVGRTQPNETPSAYAQNMASLYGTQTRYTTPTFGGYGGVAAPTPGTVAPAAAPGKYNTPPAAAPAAPVKPPAPVAPQGGAASPTPTMAPPKPAAPVTAQPKPIAPPQFARSQPRPASAQLPTPQFARPQFSARPPVIKRQAPSGVV